MSIMENTYFLTSTMVGAPKLTSTPGSMITVLDDALVNGFNNINVTSITTTEIGISEATCDAACTYEVGRVITFTPSFGSETGYKVLSVSGNTFTFNYGVVVNDTDATPRVAKYKPLGWTKEFSGTSKGVYRPLVKANEASSFLRIDDTGVYNATVFGYENMTDVDTGTSKFPEIQTANNYPLIFRCNQGGITDVMWTIIGNENFFFLITKPYQPLDLISHAQLITFYGRISFINDITVYKNNFLIAYNTSNALTHANYSSTTYGIANNRYEYQSMNKHWDGLQVGPSCGLALGTISNQSEFSGINTGSNLSYPNFDGSLFFTPLSILLSNSLVGFIPNGLFIPHRATSKICKNIVTFHFDIIEYEGIQYNAVFIPSYYSGAEFGPFCIVLDQVV